MKTPVWLDSDCWCSNFVNLMSAQGNIFSSLMHIDRRCSISQYYVKYGLDSFNELYRKYVYSFQERLHNSDNILVKCSIFSSFFMYKSPMNLNWLNVLFIK